MGIDDMMAAVGHLQSWQTVRELPSKRNDVRLVRAFASPGEATLYVAKAYRDAPPGGHREASILQVLYGLGVPVPRLVCETGAGLVLQYLPGPTLLAEIERLERAGHRGDCGEAAALALKLCEWLAAYYRAMRQHTGRTYVFGDMHLRNFVLHQPSNVLYGVDFESCTEGAPEKDIGMVCAYAVSYDPPFTSWRISFARCLLATACRTLACPPETALRSVRRALRAIEQRRGISYPSEAIDLLCRPLLHNRQSSIRIYQQRQSQLNAPPRHRIARPFGCVMGVEDISDRQGRLDEPPGV